MTKKVYPHRETDDICFHYEIKCKTKLSEVDQKMGQYLGKYLTSTMVVFCERQVLLYINSHIHICWLKFKKNTFWGIFSKKCIKDKTHKHGWDSQYPIWTGHPANSLKGHYIAPLLVNSTWTPWKDWRVHNGQKIKTASVKFKEAGIASLDCSSFLRGCLDGSTTKTRCSLPDVYCWA